MNAPGPGGLGIGGSNGHAVNVDDLHALSGDLKNYQQQSDQIGKLIHEADVTHKAWGVVGLFAKQQYVTTLSSLLDHVREMTSGFGALSDKIKDAGDSYKSDDDKVRDAMKALLGELNNQGSDSSSGGASGAPVDPGMSIPKDGGSSGATDGTSAPVDPGMSIPNDSGPDVTSSTPSGGSQQAPAITPSTGHIRGKLV